MDVAVPSAAFRAGALLEVGQCARHAVPATSSRTRRFSTQAPGAAVLLAFFSCVIGLLVIAALSKDVRGAVPECERCVRTRRRLLSLMWLGIVGGLTLFVTSATLSSGWLGLAALAVLVAGIVVGVVAEEARVRGTLDRDLGWVQLRGVEPAFAVAVSSRIKQHDPWAAPGV